ncbi:iron-siderophore ABC transporter substrate-binding protein [soil metagenome]
MRSTRRTLVAGTAALVLGLAPLLTGCGSDDTTGAGGAGADPAGDGADAGTAAQLPVTITHKYGETTFTDVPERVVVVGLQEQDTLISLGIVPVGVTYWFGDEDGINPWAESALPEGAEMPEVLDATNGIPVEKVAALAPDLIIGEYSAMTEDEYELLSAIAPTLAQSGDYADYSMPWDEMALKVGEAVGRTAAITDIVDGVTSEIETYAGEHPEFAGRTAALVTPYEGLFVYGPDDPRTRMLGALCFDVTSSTLFDSQQDFGSSLSAENAADLDSIDLTVWYDREAEPDVAAVYEGTDAFAEGRWVDISDDDGAYWVAHSFVSPLAIPYVLERYVPQLAAAVDGDPDTVPPAVS